MSKVISFGDTSGKKVEQGVYEGRIVKIISTGIRPLLPQFSKNDDGSLKKLKEQLRFTFEITTEDDEGKPVASFIDLPYVNVTGGGKIQSKLESIMQAAKTKPGQTYSDMIGAVVSITVEEQTSKSGKTFAKVTAVGGVSANVAKSVPPLSSKGFVFDFDDPDVEVLRTLPDFIKEEFTEAVNFSGSKLEALLEQEASAEEGTGDSSDVEEDQEVEGSL